jgi:hypothetical protein
MHSFVPRHGWLCGFGEVDLNAGVDQLGVVRQDPILGDVYVTSSDLWVLCEMFGLSEAGALR